MEGSSTFGGLALVLAAFGLYGLMSYGVAQRTHEIGVHMALGLTPQGVMALVLRQSMRVVAAGILIGGVGAVGVTRWLAGVAFGIPRLDLVSLGTAAATLAVVGLRASFVPAWRAAHLDPASSLRVE